MIVCPICNEMDMVTYKCSECNADMVDKGRVQEFMDPYGPQHPIIDTEGNCLHLFECLNCRKLERKNIKKVSI